MDERKKLVFIIDLDMTLIDTLNIFYRVYSSLLLKYKGKQISFEEFYKRFCEDNLQVDSKNQKEFWDDFKRNYRPVKGETIRLLPGARKLLQSLRKIGGTIVILSGRGVEPEAVWKELNTTGISELVDEVYTLHEQTNTVGDNPFDKKKLIQAIKKRHGGKCVVIGDYIGDMQAGKAGQCYTIGVTTGCKEPETLIKAGANAVFDTLEEVRKHIIRVIIDL